MIGELVDQLLLVCLRFPLDTYHRLLELGFPEPDQLPAVFYFLLDLLNNLGIDYVVLLD